MGTYFNDNLLRFLPEEYAFRDAEFGDLKAFLRIVAISLDEFDGFIDDFTKIFDVDECDPKYLPYLARMLNYPLDDRDEVEEKRKQLKWAVEWYKRKGLEESFRILFYSLGYVINLVELWTRDYKSFSRYPGSWTPDVFKAKIRGTNLVMIDITEKNRNLRVSIDGGQEVTISLALGELRLLSDIADEIDSRLSLYSGDCFLDSGHITISSRISGAASSVTLVDIEGSAYNSLGLPTGISYGINYNIPDDWPELVENGGSWFKSPHFGIEAFSIKGYVLNEDEFDYITERIELVRPAHTVLQFLKYAKLLSDTYEPVEEMIATIDSRMAEIWPFPFCMDRGKSHEFVYIRDGLVPDRSEEIRLSYNHYRDSENTCFKRDEFEYTFSFLSRGHVTGPTQMPTRGSMKPFRGGYPEGTPKRAECAEQAEILEIIPTHDDTTQWCAAVYRHGGAFKRDVPNTYRRDGSFTWFTGRGTTEFYRSGDPEGEFTRSECKRVLEPELDILFTRPDFPGVYFRSLSAMVDPNILGIETEIPGPGDDTVLG